MLPVTLHMLFGILLLATVLLPRRRAGAAGAGLAAYAIGAGAFAAVPSVVVIGPLAARLAAVGLSPVFVGVNVGLMALGAGATMVAGLLVVSDSTVRRRQAAGAFAAAAAVAALAALVPLLRVAGLAAAVAAAAALAAFAVLIAAGRLIAPRVPAVRDPAAAAAADRKTGTRELPRVPTAATAAAVFIALVAPHALVIVAAAVVAAVAGHVAALRMGAAPRIPVLPVTAAALVPFAWMLATVAGPVGLATRALPLIPLSPQAQALVVPALAVGAWGFLGVWPLHRWVPGPVLAAVGGALLLRVGAPALGAGFEHLQPPLFALGAIAAWHAALTRRPAEFLAAIGFVAAVAIFSGAHVSAGARIAAAVLFASATAAAAIRWFLASHGAGTHGGAALLVAARVLALAAGAAIYATITAGLRAEVVLTVAIAGAAAAASWRLRGVPAVG